MDELKAGMKKAGSPVALAELQALLSHIDVDASGAPPLPCNVFMLVRPGVVHTCLKHAYIC